MKRNALILYSRIDKLCDMTPLIRKLPVYHITHVENLPAIVAAGGLKADAALIAAGQKVIGYTHIKERRLKELQVDCCGNRFVGEFVPMYWCPRSPMLFTINKGNTGLPAGCQSEIVHLVSSVGDVVDTGREWAVSDGNAGAAHATFKCSEAAIKALDWTAIRATDWRGKQHQKSAELLVADKLEWTRIGLIGCFDQGAAKEVAAVVKEAQHRPVVEVHPEWYY